MMFFAIGEESVNFIRMARTIFDIPSDVIPAILLIPG